MGKHKKHKRRRQGMQVVTLCISTTMVLILLGLVVLSVLTTRNLSVYVREHFTVNILLADSVTNAAAEALGDELALLPYTKEVAFVSKEQALAEQTQAMGSDPSEFLGVNPFGASLEMQVQADYANGDSLRAVVKQLKASHREVVDVAYQEDVMDRVNHNLRRVNIVLMSLAALLIFISYTLISNTVRLSVFARRFMIHTMKLVGASWGFIRRPFLKQAVAVGLIASLLACCALGGIAWAVWSRNPDVAMVIGWQELAVTAVAVFVFGFFIMLFCAYISVNKFLRMTAGQLYKF